MDELHPCVELEKIVCRRKSNPTVVVRIWSAINRALCDSQPADSLSLLQYLNEDAQRDDLDELSIGYLNSVLECAVGEKLLLWNGDTYGIPDANDLRQDGHDWYCFECHRGGDVMLCNSCWRVYHPLCVFDQVKSASRFICTVCKSFEDEVQPVMSQLLLFIILRLKNKTNSLYNLRNHTDEVSRALPLVMYRVVDLDLIQSRVIEQHYASAIQFKHDVLAIEHAVSVAFGASSDIGELAKMVVNDCFYEIEELQQCSDCYFMSNVKPANWFCYPCRPPHQLVYAKMRGFDYWPAKIITATPDGYNVRFFGARHERALIAEPFIRGIETNRSVLYKHKPGASLSKSLEELDLHLQMIEQKASFQMDIDTTELLKCLRSKRKHGSVTESFNNSGSVDMLSQGSDFSSLRLSESELDEDRDFTAKKPKRKRKQPKANASNSSSHSTAVINSTKQYSRTTMNSLSSIDDMTDGSMSMSTPTLSSLARKSAKGKNDRETILVRMLSEYTNQIRQDCPAMAKQTFDELMTRWCREYSLSKGDVFLRTIFNLHSTFGNAWQQAEIQAIENNKKMAEDFRQEISRNKKRQWCYNCERLAQYYCCWNTSYCSIACQREHWQGAHRFNCKRVIRNAASARFIGRGSEDCPNGSQDKS